VINDLDVDFADNLAASSRYQHDKRNIRKVQEVTQSLQVNIIHPLREGKKLLVLDIDYSTTDFSIFFDNSLIFCYNSHLGYQTFNIRKFTA
jgi:ubiquitin-like domain-containing CTD phosphatase 1